jgi:hypothetical protein
MRPNSWSERVARVGDVAAAKQTGRHGRMPVTKIPLKVRPQPKWSGPANRVRVWSARFALRWRLFLRLPFEFHLNLALDRLGTDPVAPGEGQQARRA